MAPGSDILVIGGGAIGCGIAWRLAQAGARVRLIERATPGAEASGAAAGILAPQAEAAGPGAFLNLGVESREMYPALADELRELAGVDIGYRRTGALELARTGSELEALGVKLSWQAGAGLPCEPVSPAELAELEPSLSAGWAGGFLLPREGQVEARALVEALSFAARRAGVVIQRGEVSRLVSGKAEVSGVELTDGEHLAADRVVLAAGAWSSRIAGGECPLPIEPVRGQMVELAGSPGTLTRVTFVPGGYLVPRADGRILVGSTSERVGFDKRVTVEGIGGLLQRAQAVVPGLATAPLLSSWAGLRPATADGLPILGAHPAIRGLFWATGHFRNGILLAPATSQLMADSVLGLPSPVAALGPTRGVVD